MSAELSTFDRLQGLFSDRYSSAIYRGTRGLKTIIVKVQNSDGVAYFVIEQKTQRGVTVYSVHQWSASSETVVIEITRETAEAPEIVQAVSCSGVPLPRDGSNFGLCQDGESEISALVQFSVKDDGEGEPNVGLSFMVRSDLPESSWPSYVTDSEFGSSFWDLIDSSVAVYLNDRMHAKPKTFFFSEQFTAMVVAQDVETGSRMIRRGTYIWTERLRQGDVPAIQELLLSRQTIDLRPHRHTQLIGAVRNFFCGSKKLPHPALGLALMFLIIAEFAIGAAHQKTNHFFTDWSIGFSFNHFTGAALSLDLCLILSFIAWTKLGLSPSKVTFSIRPYGRRWALGLAALTIIPYVAVLVTVKDSGYKEQLVELALASGCLALGLASNLPVPLLLTDIWSKIIKLVDRPTPPAATTWAKLLAVIATGCAFANLVQHALTFTTFADLIGSLGFGALLVSFLLYKFGVNCPNQEERRERLTCSAIFFAASTFGLAASGQGALLLGLALAAGTLAAGQAWRHEISR